MGSAGLTLADLLLNYKFSLRGDKIGGGAKKGSNNKKKKNVVKWLWCLGSTLTPTQLHFLLQINLCGDTLAGSVLQKSLVLLLPVECLHR